MGFVRSRRRSRWARFSAKTSGGPRRARHTTGAAFGFRLAIVGVVALSLGGSVPVAAASAWTLAAQNGKEIEQGRRADEQIRAQFGVYEDEAVGAYVTRIGERLAAESERPALPWTFRVLDSPVVNAFALPGGFVYITRGTLAHANSEAEVAGIIGHEIGHITGRHGEQRQQRSALVGLGLMLGSMLSRDFSRYALQTGLAQQGLGLLLLKYSRGQELDADARGVRYAAAAGYDPTAFSGFFETLQRVRDESDFKRVPTWASTHPNVENRRQRATTNASVALARSPTRTQDLTLGRASLLYMIDGLVFGENPREGYMDGSDFRHPDLRFAFTFPNGWEVHNGRQAVVAISPQEDAMVQLTIAPVPAGTSPHLYATGYLRKIDARVEQDYSLRVHGLEAYKALFAVRDQGGSYGVLAIWLSYNGTLYELTGVTSPNRLRRYSRTFSTSLESFRELTDAVALAVESAHIKIVRPPQPMLLRGLVESHPENTAPLDTIALINRMQPDERLEAGTMVKLVVGGAISEDHDDASPTER